MKREPYHSALKNEINSQEECSYHKFKDGSVALRHNVVKGVLPKEYNNADVFYCEIAWKGGIERFNKRASQKSSFLEFMNGINSVVKSIGNKPVIIVAGVTEGRFLSKNYKVIEGKLNGSKCKLYCYNIKLSRAYDGKDVKDVLFLLSMQYNCIGDFTCGYGRSGRIFRENGKKFIMSDYNGKCINYIKKTL